MTTISTSAGSPPGGGHRAIQLFGGSLPHHDTEHANTGRAGRTAAHFRPRPPPEVSPAPTPLDSFASPSAGLHSHCSVPVGWRASTHHGASGGVPRRRKGDNVITRHPEVARTLHREMVAFLREVGSPATGRREGSLSGMAEGVSTRGQDAPDYCSSDGR